MCEALKSDEKSFSICVMPLTLFFYWQMCCEVIDHYFSVQLQAISTTFHVVQALPLMTLSSGSMLWPLIAAQTEGRKNMRGTRTKEDYGGSEYRFAIPVLQLTRERHQPALERLTITRESL